MANLTQASLPIFLLEERIKTFKNWPFTNKNKCNIRNMAEAGFFSVATGSEDADAVKCFLCGKELDGWEANDDPWLEHKSHADKCAYVNLGKREDDLLLSEWLTIMKQYMIIDIKYAAESAKTQVDKMAIEVRRRILSRKFA